MRYFGIYCRTYRDIYNTARLKPFYVYNGNYHAQLVMRDALLHFYIFEKDEYSPIRDLDGERDLYITVAKKKYENIKRWIPLTIERWIPLSE